MNFNELPTSPTFIQPYFIEELGCEWLSNFDIGQSSRDQVQRVNRKIRGLYSMISDVVPIWTTSDCLGARTTDRTCFLKTVAAKMLVAKYDNDIGNSHLGFLLECKRVATELTPKLVERVKELESIVEKQALELDTAKKVRPIQRIAPPKTMFVKDLITHQYGLFGEPVVERHFKRERFRL